MIEHTSVLKAAEIILSSDYLIALTGAGISSESGVPTFRGADGLWRNYDAMQLATPEAFRKDPKLVWEWYSWRQGLILGCEPNLAHLTLAKWEAKNVLRGLITQNVDNLHSRAGSKNIIQVHGSIFKLKCTECEFKGDLTAPPKDIPLCSACGSYLRPDVVWFGENLDYHIMSQTYKELDQADTILVIGTSGIVQPAASFPLIVRQHGGKIIDINIEPTSISNFAEVYITGKASEVLREIDLALDL
ncbi:MAG: NAD-dependent deacylase [Candidatus Thorarchaeota archaeon]